MTQDIKQFAQFIKFDEEQRIVEGIVSGEKRDSQGDIIKREVMQAAIPDYMKLPGGGNLREMHQPIAAGKVPFMTIDKDGNTLIQAKVVDDNAWKKVKEGVYTGFSIGGSGVKDSDGYITQLRLSEISLVDRPAYTDSKFTLVKIDNGDFNFEQNNMSKAENKETVEEVAEDATADVVENTEAIEESTEEVAEVISQVAEDVVEDATETAPEMAEAANVVVDEVQQGDFAGDIQKMADQIAELSNFIRSQATDKTEPTNEVEVEKSETIEFAKADQVQALEKRIAELEKYTSAGIKAKVVTVNKFDSDDDASLEAAKAEKRERLEVIKREISEASLAGDQRKLASLRSEGLSLLNELK